jgi:2-haloacid dehalogenase
MRLQAVLFDAYGTLFDVMSVAARAEQRFPGQGERLSALWRERQIEYSRLVSMNGPAHYRPFRELTRAALRTAAARLALPLGAADEDSLIASYDRLEPFAENQAVLATLAERGVRCGILSNGDPDMLDAVVGHAGFKPLLGPVISVQACRRYKTDPAAYALGTAALQRPAHEVLFVSSNAWDAIGATAFGYTTLWINRAAAPPEALGPLLGAEPHFVGSSLRDVLPLFPKTP